MGETMNYPDLTVGICTYKRPNCAIHCMEGFVSRFK
jgi:hypothetical protein